MPVKKACILNISTRRTLALFLSLSLSVNAAEPSPADAPKVIHLRVGGYLYNDAAHLALDKEIRRLQDVERIHRNESWLTPVLVSAGIGFLIGITLSLTVWYLLK